MAHKGEDSPPAPSDLEGWRKAIAQGKLGTFRPEALVCAVQDLGPHADRKVLYPLAKHLSDIITRMARGYVGVNHPNDGWDIIQRAHTNIWISLCDPESEDGRTMRDGLGGIVKFRCIDAIAKENRHGRIPLEPKVRTVKKSEDPDAVPNDDSKVDELSNLLVAKVVEPPNYEQGFSGDDAVSAKFNLGPNLLDGVNQFESEFDVERVLAHITDDRKRLAFRLYMENVPLRSKKFNSIAKAVGVSSKTVKTWIKEIIELLKETSEVKELAKVKA